jgi:phosphoglycolate phosphatase-like HAD superfamily hydrolase
MLILWDIDHTLIDVGGFDRAMWSMISSRLLVTEGLPVTVIPGSTIRPILRSALAQHGASPERAEELLPQALAAELDWLTDTDRIAGAGVVLPGVRAAIRRLADQPRIVQSILTGNQRRSAELKLTAFGLLDHVDLTVGAYGSDDDHRPSLVPIAQRRTAERYDDAILQPTVLIGDSVRDIAAARESGSAVIAVGTGPTSVADLESAGADVVLPDLSDTDALVAAIDRLDGVREPSA